jgi:hypothetical protein
MNELHEKSRINIPDVSSMSLHELHSELSKQQMLYSTEKDINKANEANWNMTILLNEISKRKVLNDAIEMLKFNGFNVKKGL